MSLAIVSWILMHDGKELAQQPWMDSMLAPIYSEDQVNEAFDGFRAKVSRTYRMRSVVLKPEMPVLWGQKGGNVKFFALEHDTEFLIYEDLQPLPSLVLWALVETIPTHWHMESD